MDVTTISEILMSGEERRRKERQNDQKGRRVPKKPVKTKLKYVTVLPRAHPPCH